MKISNHSIPAILRIAVAAPLPELFDYLPPHPATSVQPGMRVLVPFGRGQRLGLIVAWADTSAQPSARLKRVIEVLDAAPLFSDRDLEFILWSARYYRVAPSEALLTALPARLRQKPTASRASRTADAHPQPPDITGAVDVRPRLNADQDAAFEAVRAQQGFAAFLLDGVTGSGKTEVYLRLIEQVLDAGGQALVLVPEIGLTPQLEQGLRARLDVPLAVLHSALGPSERERQWRQAASGQARVLLGTRSAIFTPLPGLALIIVDEEHDLSFKQQEGFRYSARDLAVRRAQMIDCPVVLGSATPALESLRNAELGRYRRLILSQRAGQAQLPEILVTDIRGQRLETGLGPKLLTQLEADILAGHQVLLFLNRRGFSPVLTCHDCGWISECSRCDARLSIHRNRGELHCHHCGLIRPLPACCPQCQGPDLRPIGQGTERVEDSLRQRFPGIPLARIDRDSTRRKGELERLLAGAARGEFRILLGTQMLAKGHHLPDLTLVGILDLDHGFYGTDFRATERMAQLLVQVAGRAGRVKRAGRVILQTRHPHHPLLRALLTRGYGTFARAALKERQAAELPPFAYQVLIRADSPREQAALAFLQRVAVLTRAQLSAKVQLWGPAPASMEQRAGRYRAQLLLQSPERAPLHQLLDRLLPALRALPRGRDLRFSLDVDPQDSL